MSRLSIVGCEGSGKTVFMAAMADHYRPGPGVAECLVPENSAANRFAEYQRRQMRVLRQWPPATDPERTVRMEWSLRRKGKKVMDVGMLEFGGETFRAAFRGEGGGDARKAAVQELVAHLFGSDTVIVLVSIKDLLRDQSAVGADEFERDVESLWVTRGLLDFVRSAIPSARLVVGLTRADRYRAELEAAGGAAALFASRWPTVSAAAPKVAVVAVASVSAVDGEGRPAEDYDTDGILPAMQAVAFGRIPAVRRRYLMALLAASALLAVSKVVPFDRAIANIAERAESNWWNVSAPTALVETNVAPPVAVVETNAVADVAVAETNEAPDVVIVETNAVSVAVVETNVLPVAVVETNVLPVAVVETNVVSTEVAEEPPRKEPPRAVNVVVTEADKALAVFSNRLARAKSGDLKCQRWLGNQYYKGTESVQRDLAEARRWYRESADGGDHRAQACLGSMLECGEGGPPSAAESMEWYRKAAEGGVAEAMFRLGKRLWESAVDDREAALEAYEWLLRAKSAGCANEQLDAWIMKARPRTDAADGRKVEKGGPDA